jgi:hypothetical protein
MSDIARLHLEWMAFAPQFWPRHDGTSRRPGAPNPVTHQKARDPLRGCAPYPTRSTPCLDDAGGDRREQDASSATPRDLGSKLRSGHLPKFAKKEVGGSIVKGEGRGKDAASWKVILLWTGVVTNEKFRGSGKGGVSDVGLRRDPTPGAGGRPPASSGLYRGAQRTAASTNSSLKP